MQRKIIPDVVCDQDLVELPAAATVTGIRSTVGTTSPDGCKAPKSRRLIRIAGAEPRSVLPRWLEPPGKDRAPAPRIRDIWEACPFYGHRKIAEVFDGHVVNHKRVRRLMKAMGIAALYATPKTSQAGRDHVVYPYLLRGVDIIRPDQVWQVDITYIKLPVGFA